MIKIKNKKAQVELSVIWLYRFFILVLVLGVTIGVVIGHYSKQIDIRNLETAVVAREIVDCIAPDGIIKEFSEDAVKECLSLNEQEMYLNLTLGKDNIDFGQSSLAVYCKAKEKVSLKYPPSCLEQKYYLLQDNENKQLELFLAIKKFEKNL